VLAQDRGILPLLDSMTAWVISMIDLLALAVVALTGLYLLALAAGSLLMPAQAQRFLLGFAETAPKHYVELLLRVVVGAAFVQHAPRTEFPDGFVLFGGILLVTSAALLLIPWRWHRQFARTVVPRASRHIALIGLASLAVGGVIMAVVVRGAPA
jgi:hypothetical protein